MKGSNAVRAGETRLQYGVFNATLRRRGANIDLRGFGMKVQTWVVMAGLVAMVSGTALAFDVQQGAKAPGAPAEQAPAPGASSADGAARFSDGSTQGKGLVGTEIRIPGLGRLGVLPKMDFGLELLYGANETKPVPEAPALPEDEFTVRGTVKHRF